MMTVAEIFTELSRHMIEGIMIHEHLSNYYDYLGLKGYGCCHEFHYLAETISHRRLCRYYIEHFNMLIDDGKIENPAVIPESWYRYTRQDVDTSTKRNAVKDGLERWVQWERGTKTLYQEMYCKLLTMAEIGAAGFVLTLIKDVDEELCKAESYKLDKEATGYDIGGIIGEQEHKRKKYCKKICRLMD